MRQTASPYSPMGAFCWQVMHRNLVRQMSTSQSHDISRRQARSRFAACHSILTAMAGRIFPYFDRQRLNGGIREARTEPSAPGNSALRPTRSLRLISRAMVARTSLSGGHRQASGLCCDLRIIPTLLSGLEWSATSPRRQTSTVTDVPTRRSIVQVQAFGTYCDHPTDKYLFSGSARQETNPLLPTMTATAKPM